MTWPHGRKNPEKGTKRRVAVKNPKTRQMAYLDFCDHIANGFSRSSWRFRGPSTGSKAGESCTFEAMEGYMKDTKEFDPELMRKAVCDGLFLWERRISDAAIGANKAANIAGMQMFMRNVFGWDRPDSAEPAHITEAMAHFSRIAAFLKYSSGKISASGRAPSIGHNT